jgi:hypothetical protein
MPAYACLHTRLAPMLQLIEIQDTLKSPPGTGKEDTKGACRGFERGGRPASLPGGTD